MSAVHILPQGIGDGVGCVVKPQTAVGCGEKLYRVFPFWIYFKGKASGTGAYDAEYCCGGIVAQYAQFPAAAGGFAQYSAPYHIVIKVCGHCRTVAVLTVSSAAKGVLHNCCIYKIFHNGLFYTFCVFFFKAEPLQ